MNGSTRRRIIPYPVQLSYERSSLYHQRSKSIHKFLLDRVSHLQQTNAIQWFHSWHTNERRSFLIDQSLSAFHCGKLNLVSSQLTWSPNKLNLSFYVGKVRIAAFHSFQRPQPVTSWFRFCSGSCLKEKQSKKIRINKPQIDIIVDQEAITASK